MPAMAGPQREPGSKANVLTGLLLASVISTAVHYTDNYVAFASYPGSEKISRADVPISWVALTAVGIAGYVLYRRGRRLAVAHGLLATYALTGLTTPLHYLAGSPSELPLWRNFSIMCDGLTGLAVLAYTVRSGDRSLRRNGALSHP
jgi:hypothetical protein